MGNIKQKRKSTRELHLPENSRADSKRAEKDVVYRMVRTSLEIETRCDVYGDVKNNQLCHFF